MGSSRRRCCCKNVEGCNRCTTPPSFFGIEGFPWCGSLVYGFTFGGSELLLPEIKSNYTFEDYLLTVITYPFPMSPCDCDNTIIPDPYLISLGLTLFYDINVLTNSNGNVIDANRVGCTYDNRDVFTYDLETREMLAVTNYIGMHDPGQCPPYYHDPISGITYFCGFGNVPTDIEAFIGPAYGITQHNNAAFSCQFRACGQDIQGIPKAYPLIKTCDPYDLIPDNLCSNSNDPFYHGVTFIEADSYVLKRIKYFPVIRTIDKTIPEPTPDCFYQLDEPNIPGSVNIPTGIIRTCYVPSEEEECRCQSGLIVEVEGRAEQQNTVVVYEEEQIIGPGGQLVGNRNFIAVGITMSTQSNTNNWQPAIPVGKCKIRLYYFGCIDDTIYDLPSPSERVFTLDAGVFDYEGVFRFQTPLYNPNAYNWNRNFINLESLPAFETCPNRPVNCNPNAFSNKGKVLPASFFVDLGMPEQITVKRLS